MAVFGRRARLSALDCAEVARYRSGRDGPPCSLCGALRAISRLTVDGARPNLAAIERLLSPAANPTAISSRSGMDR